MENEKVNAPTSGEDIKIPEFMQSKKSVESGEPEFKYIKCDGYKRSWKSLKEIDDLIGTIMSRDDEPTKVKIKYQIRIFTDNKTENIKGSIDTDLSKDTIPYL